MSETVKLKKALTRRLPKAEPPRSGLSTGSTLLNLACSGNPNWGLAKGTYNLFVGDTNSGKTFFSKGFLAEASINPAFDGYRLIFDDTERGDKIDTAKFFGERLAKRIEPPKRTKDGSPIYSETVEDMYRNVDDALKAGPFVYVVDSETCLTCEADVKKAKASKWAAERGEDAAGSYGTDKAKVHSSCLRRLLAPLEKSGSILVVVNQTRDRIGWEARFNPKTRPGGRALEFYATVAMWSKVAKVVKKEVAGEKVQLGILSEIHVKRTRITGRDRTVEVPIYHSLGVDDVGSCCDYLVSRKHWPEDAGRIEAPEWKFSGRREKLIRKIEEEGLEKELRLLVMEKWNEIEAASTMQRKKRY